MKTRITKQGMRNGAIAVTLSLFGFVANAQQTTGSIAKQTVAKSGDIGNGGTTEGGSIRVIDNKGTIKYLQVKNGITQITNDTPGGVVTTWQLGGELSENTAIDLKGKTLSLKTMAFNVKADGTETTENPGANKAAVDQTATTGFSILVRDEATGNMLKMLPSDMLKAVKGGQTIQTIGATPANVVFQDDSITPELSKIWVYRNGAKLLAGIDYAVSGTTVTVNKTGLADPDDYNFVSGDKIEIQWTR
jgi:hypothetical protein